MTLLNIRFAATTAIAVALAACSSDPSGNAAAGNAVADNVAENVVAENAAADLPANVSAPGQADPAPVAADVLTLEGLGPLRIGKPVPAGSGWAERGAQIPGACRTVSSPDVPGVYAIVIDGVVRRISAGERSKVKLIEGIGSGSTEQAVRAAFPGFRESPHKYVESPAKYLAAPNAESGDPALNFEINRDGKVSIVHVGTAPVLQYVEGCA